MSKTEDAFREKLKGEGYMQIAKLTCRKCGHQFIAALSVETRCPECGN